jgi:hypothetical protein
MVSTGAVLDLDKPQVRIELLLAGDLRLHVGFGHEFMRKEADEQVFDGPCVIERTLWRRPVQGCGAIEFRHFDEDCARLLRATAADGGKAAFSVAATDIGRHPDRTFETHEKRLVDRRAVYSRQLREKVLGHKAGDRHHPVLLKPLDRFLRVGAEGTAHTDGTITETGQRAL